MSEMDPGLISKVATDGWEGGRKKRWPLTANEIPGPFLNRLVSAVLVQSQPDTVRFFCGEEGISGGDTPENH